MLQDSIQSAPLGRQRLADESFKDLHGMTASNAFRVAWEGVMLNKLRSFLTTLGIIIGVAAVIIMLAVSAGAEAEIEDQISGLGANLITPFRAFGGVRGAGGGFPGGGGNITALTYDDVIFLSLVSGVSLEQGNAEREGRLRNHDRRLYRGRDRRLPCGARLLGRPWALLHPRRR